MVKAIIIGIRAAFAWRDLPDAFGSWQTVRTWHRHMCADGMWDEALVALTALADADGAQDWSVAVHWTIARSHQRATPSPLAQGAGSNFDIYDPSRSTTGSHGPGGGLCTKDLPPGHGHGLTLAVAVGQANEAPALLPLLAPAARHPAVRSSAHLP